VQRGHGYKPSGVMTNSGLLFVGCGAGGRGGKNPMLSDPKFGIGMEGVGVGVGLGVGEGV